MTARLCRAEIARNTECGRLILDQAWICQPCTTRMTHALTDLPRSHADLTAALTPTRSGADRVTGTPTRPLPIRLDVAAHRHDIAAFLHNEAGMWQAELLTTAPPADLPGIGAWLARWTVHARHHEWSAATHDAALALRTRARHLLDLPQDRARFQVASCPDCHHPDARVWAHVPTDQAEPAYLACDACDRTWRTLEWHSFGRRVGAQLRGARHGSHALVAAITRGA